MNGPRNQAVRNQAATKAGAPAAPATGRLEPALLRLCSIVVLGSVAATLDATVVNVAVDSVGETFHAPAATIQGVSTGYLLAMSMVIPVSGWSVDRFGAKWMWLFALAIFLGASMLCGLAWSSASLIAFRLLQGVGGGLIVPLAQIILARAAGPARIGRVMTLVSIPTQLAPIVGPTVGGAIIDQVGWRWVFYINVPICLLALALASVGMPTDAGRREQRLDVRGLVLLSGGLGAVVYGLSTVDTGQPGAATAAGLQAVLLTGGAVSLTVFAVHALRSVRTPIIDLRLFRSRTFSVASALMFLFGLSLFSMMFLLPLYYQQIQGAGSLHAGLLLAPQGVGAVLALIFAGHLTDRYGARPLVLGGLVVSVLGTLAYTQVQPNTSELLLGASLVVRGIGLGTAAVPLMAVIYQGGLPSADIPQATSAVNVFQRLGGAVGTALLAVILQHETSRADDADALAAGFGRTFWWTVAFTLVALVPAWLLARGRLGRAGPE